MPKSGDAMTCVAAAPGVIKFKILVDPSLVHHHYTLNLFDPSPGVEKKIFKENNVFSLYDLYGHTLAQEPLPHRS